MVKESKKGVQSKVKPYIDEKKGIKQSRNSKAGVGGHKASISSQNKLGMSR